ncbi:hypothetical protein ElyMa_005581700 [Elysia marginata]|uniref:Uncharacterized protein n=1 Tax=Elysia marginata TaxID=1093978 RepID=A0AAV4F303_9GAST|nr:hypothetical protein ElyMa_005581700 [Elysia marginata]
MAQGGILGSASIPFFGCVVLLLAMVLHILAFAFPDWATDSEGKFGLWRVGNNYCGAKSAYSEACRRYRDYWTDFDWFLAVRALECLTIIFWAFPLVILPVYIYVALGLYYRCMMVLMACFTFLGAACNIIGVVIFGIEVEESSDLSLRWCLPMCAVAGCIGLLAFIAYFLAVLKRPKFEHQQHFLSGFYVDPYKNRMYVVETTDPPADVAVVQPNDGVISPEQVNPAMVYN